MLQTSTEGFQMLQTCTVHIIAQCACSPQKCVDCGLCSTALTCSPTLTWLTSTIVRHARKNYYFSFIASGEMTRHVVFRHATPLIMPEISSVFQCRNWQLSGHGNLAAGHHNSWLSSDSCTLYSDRTYRDISVRGCETWREPPGKKDDKKLTATSEKVPRACLQVLPADTW